MPGLQKGVQDIAQAILPESHIKPQGFREEFARENLVHLYQQQQQLLLVEVQLPLLFISGVGGAPGSTIGQNIFGPIGGIIGGFAGA